MARHHRSGTPATRALDTAGVSYTLHEYVHDEKAPAYGPEAAESLGVDPDRVYKTLVASADGRLVVGVVPVSGHLDLKALAHAVGAKRAEMADPADAQRRTGYVVGGISPLGQRTRLRTVIDEGAQDFDTVFCSAGRRGLDVELSPADLVRLTHAETARIRRAD